jgi:hypothetical protein
MPAGSAQLAFSEELPVELPFPLVVPVSLNGSGAIAGGAVHVSLPSSVRIGAKPGAGVGLARATGVGAGARRLERRGMPTFSCPGSASTTSKSPSREKSLPRVFIRGETVPSRVVAGLGLPSEIRAQFRFPRSGVHYAWSYDLLQDPTNVTDLSRRRAHPQWSATPR